MGGGGSKSETVTEFFPELDGWVPCPGIGNGDFFPGRCILCKTDRCSATGQILLDTQEAAVRFEGGPELWSDIQRHVKKADNSPQQLAFTFAKGEDINVWFSAYAKLQLAAGEKRTKQYKIVFEQTRKVSVDIDHFKAAFQKDRVVLNQCSTGILGEQSFLVVTDVFAVGKMRCETSKRIDRHLQANISDPRDRGVSIQTTRTASTEASQCCETPIALYMKCAEVKYDPNSGKITDINRCDASTFRQQYTLMDETSHFPRHLCTNAGDITVAYRVTIDSGTGTSADVFLQLVDQDYNWSDPVRLSNPWWGRKFASDRPYSSVIRVHFRNTGGPNNNSQSAGHQVSKVKVWHDNSGWRPGWFVNKVVLQNLKTGELQEFPFYRWLSRGRDDNRIAREVTKLGTHGGQVTLYKVRVTTVDKWWATTKTPVIVCLIGSLGQSERVQVMGELKRGRDTEFTIVYVAPQLGDLRRVELGLNGNGYWLLEKIEVKSQGSRQLAFRRFEMGLSVGSNTDAIELAATDALQM